MARLQLNKSSLAQQSKNLKTYEKFLPSLDLKRQQLMSERAKAKAGLQGTLAQHQAMLRQVKEHLPMLASADVVVEDLVSISKVDLVEENIVGTKLPAIKSVAIEVKEYSTLAKPHWVDNLVDMLSAALKLALDIQVQQERLGRLDKAVTTITQRVNLFDKVLIPQTKGNIKKIRIYLSDEQMAAVVRSKIAKGKRIGARA